jgi:hypothetical protein
MLRGIIDCVILKIVGISLLRHGQGINPVRFHLAFYQKADVQPYRIRRMYSRAEFCFMRPLAAGSIQNIVPRLF